MRKESEEKRSFYCSSRMKRKLNIRLTLFPSSFSQRTGKDSSQEGEKRQDLQELDEKKGKMANRKEKKKFRSID